MKERYIVRCTKLATIVKYLYSIRDIYWAKHLASLEVQPQGIRFSVKSRELCIDEFDLCLSWGKHAYFLSGLHLEKTLKYLAGANFYIDESRRLLCHVKDVTAVIQSLEEIWRGWTQDFAKIDCEGVEYEIIDSLYQSGKLNDIEAIVMEWHRDGPDQLTERLMDAGFTVTSLGRSDVAGQGMIYAVRSQSPIVASAGRWMAWVRSTHERVTGARPV